MDSANGYCDPMDPRLHSASLRQKSKVPRARCSTQYADPTPAEFRTLRTTLPQGMSLLHPLGDTDECKEWQRLVGERVCISGVKQGVLRYFGRTNFAQGCWCGVELDEPVGKNNGTVNGVVYFSCRPNHGIFAPVSKVSKMNDLGPCDWQLESKVSKHQEIVVKQEMVAKHQMMSKQEMMTKHHEMMIKHQEMGKQETISKHQEQSSKLKDLNSCDWYLDPKVAKHREMMAKQQELIAKHQEQSSLHRRSNWEYNLSLLADAESGGKKFLKNSLSEPTFMRTTLRMPRSSESFPFDRPNITEQRDVSPLNVRNFDVPESKHGRIQTGTVNAIKTSSSSRSLSKYGYSGKKNQYYNSNGTCPGDSSEVPRDARSGSTGGFQNSGLTMTRAEYEQFLRTPTNSGQGSPLTSEAKRFNEMPFYDYGKSPEGFLSAFQPHDFSDFEDEADNDDHMSVDYDESLGILTPSQMRDLTLGADFPASLNGMRGMDFPSSESFDDINELPEDEQVHDVSVFHLSDTSTTRNVEVSQQSSYGGQFTDDKVSLRKPGDFLNSISQREMEGYNVESRFESTVSSYQDLSRTHKINNLSASSALCSDLSNNREKEINDKYYNSQSLSKLRGEEEPPCAQHSSIVSSDLSFTQYPPIPATQNQCEMDTSNVTNFQIQADKSKTKNSTPKNFDIEDGSRKNYDTDSSRDSLLQAESENNTTLKEKLTVSWEDCLSRNNDSMYTHVERPESVYTVGSSDTGYQEDGELEGDMGMATSLDSTDGTKRFSTTSRDSCIVSDEVDGYKIAESNTTSGYSTGLSDSCCNDRAEDDLSSKPMTDEEIQDSVGPCDSEDAFSFQESNSLSKDTEMVNAEASDLTTEIATALCNNDSASDALCETMVEDSTLTEIHDLLLSPEDKTSSPQDPQEPIEAAKEGESESKTTDRIDSGSCCSGSTPEKKAKTEPQQRSQTGVVTKSVPKMTSESSDKKKQMVTAKSPKKNVMSKIKAMIEATSCKTAGKTKPEPAEPVNRRVVSAPKKSRWEAVTSKIAASLAEEKTKPKAKREIRSRVDTNLSSARQQSCRSPRLDSSRVSNCGDGSMSPMSVSSRDRRERNSAPLREGRVKLTRDTKQRPKSPRPGTACITSRSASPVAASESSTTSVSVNSHNSRSKIAHWKGSNSTIASSVPPQPSAIAKRSAPAPATKPPLQSARARMVTKKPLTVPKIRITPSAPARGRSSSPAISARAERNNATRPNRATKEQVGGRAAHSSSKPVRPPMWLSKAELTQEIQRLGNLCEARTKELNRLKMETKHVSVGFDAFAALFKYMVEDLNALSVPMLSADLQKTLKQLELAKQDLAYYEREVEEMKAHHCQELNDLSNKLFEVFQGEVTELSAKHQEEMNHLNHDHQKQIENLTTNLNSSSAEVIAQHEELVTKLQQELINQREELQLFQEREILDLEEKHSQSTKTLQEHIEQLQKKCAELKQHSMGMEDAMRKDTDSKLQWVTARKVDLEKEVESLKAVLEMKNKELHTIRIQNLEMEKQLEELPLAREKIKALQARAEDLEALMIEKTKLERKLSNENHQIRETYEKESKVNRRLSMENEELQWRLRQAEQSIISGSFSEVAEYPEDEENGTPSPAKSPSKSPGPHVMSRSVFFTFVDKEDHSSPKSQYKKITPGFSSSYKTSPAKSSKSPRSKSHSEPPMLCSTPRSSKASSKQKSTPKRQQRSGSECGKPATEETGAGFLSVTASMASSVSSESSVFEHKERILEEHKDQIMHSLEILREQRIAESTASEEQESVTLNKEQIMQSLENLHEQQCNLEGIGSEEPELVTSNDTSPQLFNPEDMSRSSEFSDPKTYYHMTFPVLKEPGMPDGDMDDSDKVTSHDDVLVAQLSHSKSNGNGNVDNMRDTDRSESGAMSQHIHVKPSLSNDDDCKQQTEPNVW